MSGLHLPKVKKTQSLKKETACLQLASITQLRKSAPAPPSPNDLQRPSNGITNPHNRTSHRQTLPLVFRTTSANSATSSQKSLLMCYRNLNLGTTLLNSSLTQNLLVAKCIRCLPPSKEN